MTTSFEPGQQEVDLAYTVVHNTPNNSRVNQNDSTVEPIIISPEVNTHIMSASESGQEEVVSANTIVRNTSNHAHVNSNDSFVEPVFASQELDSNSVFAPSCDLDNYDVVHSTNMHLKCL